MHITYKSFSMKQMVTGYLFLSLTVILMCCLAGCSLFKGNDVNRITVAPDPVEFSHLGERIQLTAIAYNEDGEELSDKIFAYHVEDMDIATVDQDGWITSQDLGSTTITVTCEETQAATSIRSCGCVEEIYEYNAMDEIINTTRNHIPCFPYLESVFETGGYDIQEAIDNGALEVDGRGRVIKYKYKTCE